MRAYYNEFDQKAAAWLRQLIKNGDITQGEVDERSIDEVKASDLVGFDRAHFFAGIGTWDYCLNQSGWGNKPVWTASLPCQPFSVAGKGLGKSDERHLLPHFLELVRQCKPDAIFGEQVERAINFGWLDDLQANMEAEGYAIGHCVLGAHSIGAAHIRQRLYWVADSLGEQRKQRPNERSAGVFGTTIQPEGCFPRPCDMGAAFSRMGISNGTGSQQGIEATEGARYGYPIESAGCVIGTGNTEHDGRIASKIEGSNGSAIQNSETGQYCTGELEGTSASESLSWIYCRDNKYRPVKPGILPLVDGIARGMVYSRDTSEPINANATQEARAMRLKGYGNAIQAQTAMAFISAYMSL